MLATENFIGKFQKAKNSYSIDFTENVTMYKEKGTCENLQNQLFCKNFG